MVIQQCVACNLKVSAGTEGTSCVCGHVFAAKKLIGGKRFSSYRAELYSRIESKRQHTSVKENRPTKSNYLAVEACSMDDKEKVTNCPQVLHTKNNKTPHCSVNRPVTAHVQGRLPLRTDVTKTSLPSFKPSSTCCKPRKVNNVRTTTVPPEVIARFPKALAEINKRLISQSFIWTNLSNE